MGERCIAVGDRGFTLVEVLAALAIFSIAGLALVRVSTENTRTAQLVEGKALAAIAVDNHLAELLTSRRTLRPGATQTATSFAGRDWIVEQTILETPNPVVLEIRVSAAQSLQNGRRGVSVQRRAYVRRRR